MIVYIILIALIAQLYFYKPSNALACGLFGWSGDDSSKINHRALTVLGLFNQDRGTDASGIMTNTKSLKSVVNGSFDKFIVKDLYYEDVIEEDTTIVLAHTRNSSPGTKRNVETAQPCIIEYELEDPITDITSEKGVALAGEPLKYNFGLIHNGNIKSAGDRIVELGFEKSELSDSYDFHNVLMETEDVKEELKNYTGKAALVWTSSEGNDIMHVFKGASKATRAASVVSEERPLFYVIPEEGSLYFSSTEESLIAAFNSPDIEVMEFESNVLYTITCGVIDNREIIDRSESYQVEPVKVYNNTGSYNRGHRGQSYQDEVWGNYTEPRSGSVPYVSKANILEARSVMTKTNHYGVHLTAGKYFHKQTGIAGGFKLLTAQGNDWNPNISKSSPVWLTYFNSGYLISLKYIQEVLHITKNENKNILGNNALEERYKFVTKMRNPLNLFQKASGVPVWGTPANKPVNLAQLDNTYAKGKCSYYFTTMSAIFANGDLKSVDSTGIATVHEKVGLSLNSEEATAIYNILRSDIGITNINKTLNNIIQTKNTKTLFIKEADSADKKLLPQSTEIDKGKAVEAMTSIVLEEESINEDKENIIDSVGNIRESLEALAVTVKLNEMQESTNFVTKYINAIYSNFGKLKGIESILNNLTLK